jgi:hypothetical protein
MTRRRPHDDWHEFRVLAAAIATLLLILAVSELTDTDESPVPVQPPASVERGRFETALSGQSSRSLPRPVPPSGAGHPDTSGRPEDAGKRQLSRPVVGQTLRCIRWHESRGDYQAFNGVEHYGAYQLSATYSDDWARKYGYGEWANVTADQWPPSVQDAVAVALFADWRGAWSTLGSCI